MIRLGLRLSLNGGREALLRLMIVAAAVALGVGMLLTTFAGINAVNAQNGRYAWLESGAEQPAGSVHDATVSPMWWLLSGDRFDGKLIGRVDIATTGTRSPAPPPGIARLPRVGEYFASPAMAKLLRSTLPAELGDRYPGRPAGTIGRAGLPAPDSLVIVIGRRASDLAHVPGAQLVSRISTTSPGECNGSCASFGIDANGIDLVLAVTAAALIVPLLIFIGTATRLSASRREERFAAMRLVGATPHQVLVISTVESTVASAAGVGLGFGLFFALRPLLRQIPFTGARFFLSDLSLTLTNALVVAIGVPLAAALAARLALRRVNISPLGVTRKVTPRPPRAHRLIPLLAGIAELVYFAAAGRPATNIGQTLAFVPGIITVMIGLVVAGPWVTMTLARRLARRTRRPATLIAGRRLSDNPQAGFRAVSGLVVALFVASVAVGMITTINAYEGTRDITPATDSTLTNDFTEYTGEHPVTSVRAVDPAVLAATRAIAGVRVVTVIHEGPDAPGGFPLSLAICADLARVPALGHCPAGAVTAVGAVHFGGRDSTTASSVWLAGGLTPAQVRERPVRSVAVVTDGSTAAIERTRTTLERAYPLRYSPATVSEQLVDNPGARQNAQFGQLANVVIVASLTIAGFSLTVSVATGLRERKRPFSLLRLTGAPLGMLRRVVALESVVPLIATAALSVAAGFLAAGLFLKAQLQETLQSPGVTYYALVVGGLLVSLAVIASTLPLLERITGPEAARNE